MRGTITTEMTVWCALCDTWEQQPCSKKRDMAHLVKEGGWRLTRGRGWLCPSCAAGRGEGVSR